MEYEIIESGRFRVLVVFDMVDLQNITELNKIILSVIESRHPNIAIELKGNRGMISSSVIGALVTMKKKVSAQQGVFKIINVGESAMNAITSAGLDDFFAFSDSIDDLEP